jgi:predicted metal-dependent hydrolase
MAIQGGGEEDLDALDVDSPGQAVADDEMMAADDDTEISLEEILAELDKEDKKMEEAAEVPGSIKTAAADTHKVEEMKKDLHEAHKAIKAMKHELNEVNLLNAKLLYVNKIFKAKSLNESQKVKVLNAFDRATSIKEVENTYKTLNESIGEASKKSSLKESVGFASKPIGSAPARPIVDADPFINRWQQLAGIK